MQEGQPVVGLAEVHFPVAEPAEGEVQRQQHQPQPRATADQEQQAPDQGLSFPCWRLRRSWASCLLVSMMICARPPTNPRRMPASISQGLVPKTESITSPTIRGATISNPTWARVK